MEMLKLLVEKHNGDLIHLDSGKVQCMLYTHNTHRDLHRWFTLVNHYRE